MIYGLKIYDYFTLNNLRMLLRKWNLYLMQIYIYRNDVTVIPAAKCVITKRRVGTRPKSL